MNGVQNLRSVYEMRGGEESINGRWWTVDGWMVDGVMVDGGWWMVYR